MTSKLLLLSACEIPKASQGSRDPWMKRMRSTFIFRPPKDLLVSSTAWLMNFLLNLWSNNQKKKGWVSFMLMLSTASQFTLRMDQSSYYSRRMKYFRTPSTRKIDGYTFGECIIRFFRCLEVSIFSTWLVPSSTSYVIQNNNCIISLDQGYAIKDAMTIDKKVSINFIDRE